MEQNKELGREIEAYEGLGGERWAMIIVPSQ